MKHHHSVIIIGAGCQSSLMEAALQNAAEQKAAANSIKAFQDEAIPFINYRQNQVDPVFYEREPSKYFGKPKNNFKK